MTVYTYNRFEVPFASRGTTAVGVNDADQIVGFFGTPVSSAGFLESGGTYTIIAPPLAVVSSGASGINNLGQIVGSYQDASYAPHGFLYSNGTYTTLDDPLAAPGSIFSSGGTFAYGINDMGQIVGAYLDNSPQHYGHGFLYIGGAFTTIDVPSGRSTSARGINASGQIVGDYYDGTGRHGFFYNPSSGTYTTLDDPLATYGTIAYGINDLGQIVGTYDVLLPDTTSPTIN